MYTKEPRVIRRQNKQIKQLYIKDPQRTLTHEPTHSLLIKPCNIQIFTEMRQDCDLAFKTIHMLIPNSLVKVIFKTSG